MSFFKRQRAVEIVALVSVCVARGNAPCNLQPISGGAQVATESAFQPIVLRVTDSAPPPNSAAGAPVAFLTTVFRPGGTDPVGGGETNSGNPAMPMNLYVSESSSVSDIHRLAGNTVSDAGSIPSVEREVAVLAGTRAFLDYPLFLPTPGGNGASGNADGQAARDVVTLPQNWVNSQEWVGTTSNTINFPSTGTGGKWTCGATNYGPYTARSQASLQQAVNDAESCRTANSSGTKIIIPAGTSYSGSAQALTLPQTAGDTSTNFIVLTSSTPPTTGQTVCSHGIQDN